MGMKTIQYNLSSHYVALYFCDNHCLTVLKTSPFFPHQVWEFECCVFFVEEKGIWFPVRNCSSDKSRLTRQRHLRTKAVFLLSYPSAREKLVKKKEKTVSTYYSVSGNRPLFWQKFVFLIISSGFTRTGSRSHTHMAHVCTHGHLAKS